VAEWAGLTINKVRGGRMGRFDCINKVRGGRMGRFDYQ
jgi:hypothetical protein